PIGNRKSTIGNVETHLLPHGGTDLTGPHHECLRYRVIVLTSWDRRYRISTWQTASVPAKLVARQIPHSQTRLSPVKSPYSPLGMLRRLLALTLMLWCAGAGCLLVSYAHGAMGEMEVAEKTS